MCHGESADSFLKLDYVVPPFPKDCWVYSEADRNFGKGYFVHLGPNVDKAISRAEESGIKLEELFLASITRYQWMDEGCAVFAHAYWYSESEKADHRRKLDY